MRGLVSVLLLSWRLLLQFQGADGSVQGLVLRSGTTLRALTEGMVLRSNVIYPAPAASSMLNAAAQAPAVILPPAVIPVPPILPPALMNTGAIVVNAPAKIGYLGTAWNGFTGLVSAQPVIIAAIGGVTVGAAGSYLLYYRPELDRITVSHDSPPLLLLTITCLVHVSGFLTVIL